jgi:hypothetical protein
MASAGDILDAPFEPLIRFGTGALPVVLIPE